MIAMERPFDIIAEEIGVERDELVDDCEFADLGVDKYLAKSILSRFHDELKLDLSASTFDEYPTAGELLGMLSRNPSLEPSPEPEQAPTPRSTGIETPPPKFSSPLSFLLQGRPQSCSKTLFLLPDGSGSGMAYARLPQLDPDICVIVLSSPYLRAPTSTTFTVPGIAALWSTEIQSRQPHGPYFLGGWSAGGYYSFEVAKHLMAAGERVEKLVLIDSPCRLVYEALPMEVVTFLSANNLMGNWSSQRPPQWLVDHFEISIHAIERYMPTPMQGQDIPAVCIIWAEECVLKAGDQRLTVLNMDMKILRMLIERPELEGALGWERLFPGAKIEVARMPGNHFTIVFPPNVSSRMKIEPSGS